MQAERADGKIVVGISSCLLGEAVRYDGGHKYHSYIVSTLGQFFEFVPFCPEMSIGLGAPREPVQLVRQNGQIRCVGTQTPSLDTTDRLITCAREQADRHAGLSGYILKRGSPSCGMEQVKVYRDGVVERNGSGLYARTLMEVFPHLPVEEEGRLGDPALRENFLQRVFVYHRWQRLLKDGLDWPALRDFHTRHALDLMSHDQAMAQDLGCELAGRGVDEVTVYAPRYLESLMNILKIHASRDRHACVLRHIRGYLKSQLAAVEKVELDELIDGYEQGRVPLLAPLTLLRHYFRRHPVEGVMNSFYLDPCSAGCL